MARRHSRSIRAPRVALLACLLVATVILPPRQAAAVQAARRSVDVLVPDAGNLQLLAFWVAIGGGYFAREGLDVRVVTPQPQKSAQAIFASGEVPVAILAGPEYERSIADGVPFLLAANLLQNDPLELVMRREVADRMHLNEKMPLRRRLEALRSISLGVAAPDRGRLYALFHSEGLDANSAQIELRKPEEMLEEFGAGKLDVLYTQTPYVERALVEKDGMLLVDAAGGDVVPFSDRMIQALAVTRAFATSRPEEVQALVRGIAKAEHALHAEPARAVEAVAGVFPKLERRRVARAVSVYARAVPSTPHVEALLISREATFYPAGGAPLDLAAADLASFVLTASEPVKPEPSAAPSKRGAHGRLGVGLALALGVAFLVLFLEQRDERKDGRRDAAG